MTLTKHSKWRDCFLLSLLAISVTYSLYCNTVGMWGLFADTVKPVLKTTCIKQSTALRDHYSDTTPLLKST